MQQGGGDPREPERSAEPAVFVAIDHAFIDEASDDPAQSVYDTLGALDASCPEAIATISAHDLRVLVRAGAHWADTLDASSPDRDAMIGAVRRLRHLLERR